MIQQDNIDDEDACYTPPVIKPIRYNKKFDMYEDDGAGPAPALEHFPAQLIADIMPLQDVKTKAKKPSVRKSKISKNDKVVDQAVVAEPKAKKPPTPKPICKKILDNGEQCKTRSQSRGLCGQHGGSKFCTFVDDKNGECGKIQFSNLGLCKGHSPKCIIDGCNKPTVGRSDKCADHDKSAECEFINMKGVKCTKNGRGKKLCIGHGGGVKCTVEGCGRVRRDKKSGKCKTHGGGKICNEYGCKTPACDGPYDKCQEHGGGPRCTEKLCVNGARKKGGKCTQHGGGNRCIIDLCTNSAQPKSDKCGLHGGGVRCIVDKCTHLAQGPTIKCVSHGGGVRCSVDKCPSGAQTVETGKCRHHGGGTPCINCVDWIDSKQGLEKYDGYCLRCFKYLKPDDDRCKDVRAHTKELMVRERLNAEFDSFIHDRTLFTGGCDCTHRRRIDHRKEFDDVILAVETDEFAHVNYDQQDELNRYNDFYMVDSRKWVFIRFNPDSNRSKVPIEEKLNTLIELVREFIRQIENDEIEEELTIRKLFY